MASRQPPFHFSLSVFEIFNEKCLSHTAVNFIVTKGLLTTRLSQISCQIFVCVTPSYIYCQSILLKLQPIKENHVYSTVWEKEIGIGDRDWKTSPLHVEETKNIFCMSIYNSQSQHRPTTFAVAMYRRVVCVCTLNVHPGQDVQQLL